RDKAFTLIEMVVVLLIIGIMFSMITLTKNLATKDTLKVKTITYEIYSAFLVAQDLAKLRNQNYGIIFSDNHYQLYELTATNTGTKDWVGVEYPKKFAQIKVPGEIEHEFSEKSHIQPLPRST